MLKTERQSARMSQITNDRLTWSGAGYSCIWQPWVSKG